MAATKFIKACGHGQEFQLFLRPNVRMREKCDLGCFDSRTIFGAILGVLGNMLLISWGLHTQPSLDFAENGAKNKKASSEQQFCGQEHVNEVRGEGPDWSKLTGR